MKPVLPHHVHIKPIQDDETHSLTVDALREAHVQSGWVVSLGPDLEEDINVGDLVIFVGWKQKNIPIEPILEINENQLYSLHEDDIEAVLEDW